MAALPGATSPHAALISAAHSFVSCCCAVAYVVQSNTPVATATILFTMGPPDGLMSPEGNPIKHTTNLH